MRKVLNKEMIEAMGLEVIKSFTDAGNTVVTNKEGAEVLSQLDREAMAKQMAEEMVIKLTTIKLKKPHKKYPSNYTPSPRKHRKK